MIIIFNLWAVLAAILSAILSVPLCALFPAVGREPMALWAVLTLVSLLMEWRGMKARVFWLPVWLVGGYLFLVDLLELLGLLNLFPLAIVGTVFGYLAYKKELGYALDVPLISPLWLRLTSRARRRAQWETAQRALEAARNVGGAQERRKQLFDAFLIPLNSRLRPEQCRHTREVVQLMLEHLSTGYTPVERSRLRLLQGELDAGIERAATIRISNELLFFARGLLGGGAMGSVSFGSLYRR